MTEIPTNRTRAVRRLLKPNQYGNEPPRCGHCDEYVRFYSPSVLSAEKFSHLTPYQVVCNVYKKKQWDRIVHFHENCYQHAGEPHGAVIEGQETPVLARNL